MKKTLLIILIASIFPQSSFAQSLDAIYRDIVKSENEGYLPLFIKNRQAPDFLEPDKLKTAPPPAAAPNTPPPISLIDKRKIAEAKQKEEEQKWQNAINAIQLNRVTPVELSLVESKVTANDPKATEIYAWMLARGVGIKQDLVKSFTMYQRAALLNVPNADKNALKVYHSMTAAQRTQIQPPTTDNPST